MSCCAASSEAHLRGLEPLAGRLGHGHRLAVGRPANATLAEGRIMLERIHRCPFCKRERTIDALERTANPFCSCCVNERLTAGSAMNPPMQWQTIGGGYARLVPLIQK